MFEIIMRDPSDRCRIDDTDTIIRGEIHRIANETKDRDGVDSQALAGNERVGAVSSLLKGWPGACGDNVRGEVRRTAEYGSPCLTGDGYSAGRSGR